VAGGSGLTGLFLQGASDTADLTTYTFASQNFGTASADRTIVAVVSGRQSGVRTVASVTIGGVTATEIATRGSSQNPLGIWSAAVPSGTSGDVVVTFSSGVLRARVVLWSVKGGAASVSDTQSGTDTINITGATGGVIIAGACNTGSGAFTWTNATERYDAAAEPFTVSGADATTVGAVTITATPSNTASNNGIVGVALAP
jgi:hypothetical protein